MKDHGEVMPLVPMRVGFCRQNHVKCGRGDASLSLGRGYLAAGFDAVGAVVFSRCEEFVVAGGEVQRPICHCYGVGVVDERGVSTRASSIYQRV